MGPENGTVFISKKKSSSGRKSSSSHVGNPIAVGGTSAPARRQFSFAAVSGRFRGWLSRLSSSSTMDSEIPSLTREAEKKVYETLQLVVRRRQERGEKVRRVVVITDLAKDYDDLAAMVVLKELHRLEVIKLLGFVANLNPAKKRARFGRGALDRLDLNDIPIATGTSGFPDKTDKKHKELDYEFECNFMAEDNDPKILLEGQVLLKQLCEEARDKKEKFTLVLISSLEDIAVFCKNNRTLLQAAVSNVVLQGGYSIEDNKLIPDEAAANNRYDIEAAKEFHTFIQESNIESAVYTKVAAFATPLFTDLFEDMAKTKHPLGLHLRHVQVEQDLAFYRFASKKDPKERFAAFMDQEWFLRNKTSWFDTEHTPDTPYPEGEEVIPYLTKVVVYDALAALGSAGPDALYALDVLTHGNVQPPPTHRIVGFAGPPTSDPGIHPEKMATALSALLKGSLLSSKCVKDLKWHGHGFADRPVALLLLSRRLIAIHNGHFQRDKVGP